MGCVQSSNPAKASDTTPPSTPSKQYVSQISAQSTLNTATSRKSTRRDSLTGWTIDSIEEYYEPIANDEKDKDGKVRQSSRAWCWKFWHSLQSSEQAKGLRVCLKENTVRDEP